MKKTITSVICSMLLAASLTLTVGAADPEQIVTGEETKIEETATEGQDDKGTVDAAESAEPDTIGAEVDTEANGENETTEEKDASSLTEQELYDAIMKVADAVGAYEDEIPAAGKAKEWIIRNLPAIVGFLMSLALFIVTPTGKKIFTKALATVKGIMEKVQEWKDELEGIIEKNGEKNSQLRTAVNEMMSVLKRENEEALKRAEDAEARAAESAEELVAAKAEAKAALDKCYTACEAVCRALLAMGTPLETTVQRTGALDQMQKDQFYEEYKKTVNKVKELLDGDPEGGESGD